MIGVHGNGLTNLLFLKPTPRSTVIEFFYPEGFAHDYEYTTRALGMVHYGFWGSRLAILSLLSASGSYISADHLQVQAHRCLLTPRDSKEIRYL